jgi:3-deoxy-D-manno-octulosonic acid (KDO) 8-phosphate synthase
MQVLQAVKTAFDVPIITDIHESFQAEAVGYFKIILYFEKIFSLYFFKTCC